MSKKRHNPEHRAFKGRSYKKGGEQIRPMREDLAAVVEPGEIGPYRLIGYRVHPKTGERVDTEDIVLCPGPFTHKEAMTAKSKFTPRQTFAIVPQEIKTTGKRSRPARNAYDPRFTGSLSTDAKRHTQCPRCSAEPGLPCREPSGRVTRRAHVERMRALIEAEGTSDFWSYSPWKET